MDKSSSTKNLTVKSSNSILSPGKGISLKYDATSETPNCKEGILIELPKKATLGDLTILNLNPTALRKFLFLMED